MRFTGILGGVVLAIVIGRPAPLSAQAPVSGACHVSPIVSDLDKTARFYHDLIGLDLVPAPTAGTLPVDDRPEHLALHGLPQAKLRFIGARMPGVFCGVELVEFTGIERVKVERRMQDPGSAMLILLVRDLDAIFARLKRDGVEVVTAGGAPVTIGASKSRVVVVKDPDGHFVEIAQLDPLPAATAAASSNVIGIRLRVTVESIDRTVQYYREVLGIEAKPGAVTKNDAVMAMMGLPVGEYRLSTAQFPGSALLLEFIEFAGLDPQRRPSRVQDPGSYRLQLNVRDIDAAVAALRNAGSRVISTGAAPVAMTFGTSKWRLAVAPDLNNLFLIVQQRLEPAR